MHSPTIARLFTTTVALVAFLTGALVSPVAATFGNRASPSAQGPHLAGQPPAFDRREALFVPWLDLRSGPQGVAFSPVAHP
jgi:hypothetical protein